MAVIVGITGASGAIYALRLLHVLLKAQEEVHLSITDSGVGVLRQELGIEIDLVSFDPRALFTVRDASHPGAGVLRHVLGQPEQGREESIVGLERLIYHHYRDFLAPIASGSFLAEGMVICPCSGTTLNAVAHAAASNLVQRAAEVQLKERRRLILVTREAPLSLPQLENMRQATLAGAVVLPASPGWYHGVRTLRDLVDFVVSRICDQLGLTDIELIKRWGTGNETEETRGT